MATTLAAQEVGSTVTLKVKRRRRRIPGGPPGATPTPTSTTPAARAPGCCDEERLQPAPLGQRQLLRRCAGPTPGLNSTFLELLDSGIRPAVKDRPAALCRRLRRPHRRRGGKRPDLSFVHAGDGHPRRPKDRPGRRGRAAGLLHRRGRRRRPSAGILRPVLDPLALHGGAAATSGRWRGESGICSYRVGSSSYGVRPALILPQAMPVKDGAVQPNSAPRPHQLQRRQRGRSGHPEQPLLLRVHGHRPPRGASLSLTEKLDQAVTRTLTAASGSTQRFEAVYDALAFLKLANGAHTLQVTASDGMASAAFQATFTKAVRAASLTLTQPIAAGKPITAATLQVEGSIPDDAAFSVQVTNNALGRPAGCGRTPPRPSARAATSCSPIRPPPRARPSTSGSKRPGGASGDGGYISKVSGAFQ